MLVKDINKYGKNINNPMLRTDYITVINMQIIK
jgi:hypothetical protein